MKKTPEEIDREFNRIGRGLCGAWGYSREPYGRPEVFWGSVIAFFVGWWALHTFVGVF